MREEPNTVLDSDQMRQATTRYVQRGPGVDPSAALLQTLIERADTWGRRRLGAVQRETSSEAGRLIAAKVKLLHEVDTAYNRLVDSAKARVKKAMAQLQEQLKEELEKLSSDKDVAVNKIHCEVQPKLDEQEQRLRIAKHDVTDKVGLFTSRIQGLTAGCLEMLMQGKSVTPNNGEGFVVICPDVEGP